MFSIRAEKMHRILLSAIHDIIVFFILQFHISRIKIMNSIFFYTGRSAIYTISVPFSIWEEEWFLLLVMNPVFGRIVSPKLRSPACKKRGVLKINMIYSMKLTQSIWVIHPACRWHHVKMQTVFITFYIFPHIFMFGIFF